MGFLDDIRRRLEADPRFRAAVAPVRRAEEEVTVGISEKLRTHAGVDVQPETVGRVGRVVVASVIAGGIAESLVGTEPGGLEAAAAEPLDTVGSTETAGVEAPTVLYDGMGNMDGTTTVTDGGVAMDFEG